jgi:hypothetical protein
MFFENTGVFFVVSILSSFISDFYLGSFNVFY